MPSWLQGLDARRLEPEWMDQPGLDAERLDEALRGLARLNRWSRSTRILWPAIEDFAQTHHLRELRILDIASGAGDVAIGLWRLGRRRGLELEVDGWEINPLAVDFAGSQSRRAGAAVRFERHDVLADRIPGCYDIIITSLFLHHLSGCQAMALLGRMAQAARGMLLVSDLRRSRMGLGLAHAAARLLTRSAVVRNDAPASVRGAFTIGEVRALARRVELADASVRRAWPFRFLLEWRRG